MSLLQALLERCQALGLVRERSDMRTDSTHIVASIRNMNRLELVGETLRAALNVLSTVDPVWLTAQVGRDWYFRYAKRFERGRLPKSKEGTIACSGTNRPRWDVSAGSNLGSIDPGIFANTAGRRDIAPLLDIPILDGERCNSLASRR